MGLRSPHARGFREAFKVAITFIKKEMRAEHGADIRIPVDQVGAEVLYQRTCEPWVRGDDS